MERADGFAHQRLSVLPRPVVDHALGQPVTRRMLVTDVGVFPEAEKHARYRPDGARETIVIVCAAGSGWVELQGVRRRVGPSTAVILPGGAPHAYGADPGRSWTVWWCHVRGEDVPELVAAVGISAELATISLRSPERAIALIDEILHTMERSAAPASLLAVSGMAWRLFTQLAVDRRLPQDGGALTRAMRYLEERIDGRIVVPELAALVGVSASHLTALFREATGGGVIAYHTALRMKRARTLLDSTELPVAEVGRLVGWNDPFYFSRQFRKTHGLSPRAYRANRKG